MKKCIKQLISIILCLLVTLIPCTSTSATTYNLNVPSVIQSKTYWCWAACGKAVVDYQLYTTISMEDFYYQATNKMDYADVSKDCVTVKNGLNKYRISSSIVELDLAEENFQLLSFNQIVNQINNNKPIISLSDTNPNGIGYTGHFRVIRGYVSNLATSENYLSLMEPHDGSYIMTSYSTYCKSSSSYWMGAVYNITPY